MVLVVSTYSSDQRNLGVVDFPKSAAYWSYNRPKLFCLRIRKVHIRGNDLLLLRFEDPFSNLHVVVWSH